MSISRARVAPEKPGPLRACLFNPSGSVRRKRNNMTTLIGIVLQIVGTIALILCVASPWLEKEEKEKNKRLFYIPTTGPSLSGKYDPQPVPWLKFWKSANWKWYVSKKLKWFAALLIVVGIIIQAWPEL